MTDSPEHPQPETLQVSQQVAATADRAFWKRYARPGLLVLVTGVSLYLLLPSLTAVFASSRSLERLTWYWAVLALVFEAGSFVCLWELNRIALHVRDWVVVACAQLAGNAVGKIVPGGGATATAFSVGMLRRAGVATGQAAAALTAAGLLQLGTVLALPILSLPAIVGGVRVDRSLATAAGLGVALLVLLVAAGVLAFASDRPLVLVGRGVEWLLNRTTRRHRNVAGLPEALLAQRDFVRSTIGPRWKAAVVSAAGATMLDYAALLCALQAVGAQPRPSLVVLAYTAGKLLALFRSPPADWASSRPGSWGRSRSPGSAPETRCSRRSPTGSSPTGSRFLPAAWRTWRSAAATPDHQSALGVQQRDCARDGAAYSLLVGLRRASQRVGEHERDGRRQEPPRVNAGVHEQRVTPRATAIAAGTRQSSPTMKFHQKRPNDAQVSHAPAPAGAAESRWRRRERTSPKETTLRRRRSRRAGTARRRASRRRRPRPPRSSRSS